MSESAAAKGGSPQEMAEALPELKFTEVVRSREPLLKVDSNQPITSKKVSILSHGEYTVVLAENAKEILVLDKQGRKLDGLSNMGTMIFDWESLKKSPQQIGIWCSSMPESQPPDAKNRSFMQQLQKPLGACF